MEEEMNEDIQSEEEQKVEKISISINIAEPKKTSKTIFLKGTNLMIDKKETNNKNISKQFEAIRNSNDKNYDASLNDSINSIRWKYDETGKIISNTNIVEWSDGTYQIQIGENLYDFVPSKISTTKIFSVDKNSLFISQGSINEKMLMKPVKNK